MRRLLAYPFAIVAAICWMIADLLWDVRQPRHEYNAPIADPDTWAVIEALLRGDRAVLIEPPVTEFDTQPYDPEDTQELMGQ